jgi:hypothetical protein
MKAAVLAMVLLLTPVVTWAEAAKPIAPPQQLQRVARTPGGPRKVVLDAALAAYAAAVKQGEVARTRLLTIIDYSLPSTERRLWVLDVTRARVLYRELVAHGKGSGDNIATAFSNEDGSFMSSLGLFVTDEAYVGKNGYSLRLRGLDPGINDHAYERAIVMHGAAYVSQAVADAAGRLGRSWGCPAVRLSIAHTLIDTIKDGTAMYVYGGGNVGDAVATSSISSPKP